MTLSTIWTINALKLVNVNFTKTEIFGSDDFVFSFPPISPIYFRFYFIRIILFLFFFSIFLSVGGFNLSAVVFALTSFPLFYACRNEGKRRQRNKIFRLFGWE